MTALITPWSIATSEPSKWCQLWAQKALNYNCDGFITGNLNAWVFDQIAVAPVCYRCKRALNFIPENKSSFWQNSWLKHE